MMSHMPSAKKENLRVAGPTPLAPSVLKALSQQVVSHRAPQYEVLQKRIIANLRPFFGTKKNDILLLTGSGTGGLEAAIVNCLSPRDKVLAVSIGIFGERFAQIAAAFGARVVRVEFPLGQPADPQVVAEKLRKNPDTKAILVTHNETSTAVTNNLEALTNHLKKVSKRELPLILVDAISSLGGVKLEVDRLGLDVVVTASQKAWMAPPGLVMILVSKRAWNKIKRTKTPRFYWDLEKAKSYAEKNQTPWTPAVSSLYGLDRALKLMLKEGPEKVFRRHRAIGEQTRKGLEKLDLKLLAHPQYASNTITAFKIPEKIDAKKWQGILAKKHGLILSGGQGPLKGKIFRLAHMGYVSRKDIDHALMALKKSLAQLTKK